MECSAITSMSRRDLKHLPRTKIKPTKTHGMNLNANELPQAGTSKRGESRLPQGSCPTDSGGGKHSSEDKEKAFKPSSKLARSPTKKPLSCGKQAKKFEQLKAQATSAKAQEGKAKRTFNSNNEADEAKISKARASDGPERKESTRKGTSQEIAEWRNLARGMSGTRVKRFWKLINAGLSGAEAKAEASKGYIPKPNQAMAAKPAFSKAKPGKPERKGERRPFLAKDKPSYAKALASIKMAVFAKETPTETLTKDQLTWISEAILDAVRVEREIKVKFLAVQFKPETLGIDCANEQSAKWLSQAVQGLSGWQGPQLKATTADKAPKNTIINVVFPRAADTEVSKILEMLDHQNEGLRISSWKVVKQCAEGEAKRLIIGIDEQSMEAIKKQMWELSYRYGTVKAYLKPVKAGKPQGSDGTDDQMDQGDVANTDPKQAKPTASQEDAQTSTDQAKEEESAPPVVMEEDELLGDLEEAETMELGIEDCQLSDEI